MLPGDFTDGCVEGVALELIATDGIRTPVVQHAMRQFPGIVPFDANTTDSLISNDFHTVDCERLRHYIFRGGNRYRVTGQCMPTCLKEAKWETKTYLLSLAMRSG